MSRPLRTQLSDNSLSIIGIPKKFRNITLEDFSTYDDGGLESVKTYVSSYISNIPVRFSDNAGIIFLGSNGVGKTMLACLILKEAYRNRYSGKRVTFIEYLSAYTKSWGTSSHERETLEDELLDRYKAVEFLVLEEVGKEVDSKVAAPILEDLLRYREDKGFVTILCTNLNRKSLEERYGASVKSLISGNMFPIVISTSDRRSSSFRAKVGEFE